MQHELNPSFGFTGVGGEAASQRSRKLESIAVNAVRKRFSPEFFNRIDTVITYQPLRRSALVAILDQLIGEVQAHISTRLGPRGFRLDVPARTRSFLLARGASDEYGARELRRTLQRLIVQPMASMVASGEVRPGTVLRARVRRGAVVLEAAQRTLARQFISSGRPRTEIPKEQSRPAA